MRKVVKLMFYGGHTINVVHPDMESANAFRNNVLKTVTDLINAKQAGFIDFTEFSFRSDYLAGIDIQDDQPLIAERILKTQEKILDTFKDQLNEGEEWRGEE